MSLPQLLFPKTGLRKFTTTIPFGAGPNPVETTPQDVDGGTRGTFTMRITNVATGYFFDMEFNGGTGNPMDPNDPANFVSFIAGTAQDNAGVSLAVTSTSPPQNRVTVTTDAADGSRVYQIDFFKFHGVPTTIFKTGGAALTGNLTILVTNCVLIPV